MHQDTKDTFDAPRHLIHNTCTKTQKTHFMHQETKDTFHAPRHKRHNLCTKTQRHTIYAPRHNKCTKTPKTQFMHQDTKVTLYAPRNWKHNLCTRTQKSKLMHKDILPCKGFDHHTNEKLDQCGSMHADIWQIESIHADRSRQSRKRCFASCQDASWDGLKLPDPCQLLVLCPSKMGVCLQQTFPLPRRRRKAAKRQIIKWDSLMKYGEDGAGSKECIINSLL